MPISFPSNPSSGATYDFGGIHYIYNGDGWVNKSIYGVSAGSGISFANYNGTGPVVISSTSFLGYDYEIHVSQVDGNDTTGNGDLLTPVASITKALTLVDSQRKTIIVHPGTYTESPSITVQYTTITGPGLIGGNIVISGTVSTNTGCTISGIKMTNLTVTTPSGAGNVNILNCEVSGTFTKSSNADYTVLRLCDLTSASITGAGLLAIFGGNPNFITVNNASANVIVKSAVTVSPVLTAGTLSIVDCVVGAAVTNAVTSAASSVITLANSQLLTSALNNVAPVVLNGFYSILNCVYDKATSTLAASSGTGGTLNSIDYFQYINADKFITQGGTSTQFVKGDGSLDSNYVISFNGLTGAVQGVSAAVAGTGISVSGATGSVTFTNTGVLSFNGKTGAVQGVSSINGNTGAITNVAFTNAAQTFSALQSFSSGISASSGITFGNNITIKTGSGDLTVGSNSAALDTLVIGNTSLVSNNSIANSIIIGKNAMSSSGAASTDSFAIGLGALNSNDSSGNFGIGVAAGYSTTLGGENFFIGNNAGYGCVEGTGNVAIGPAVLQNINNGTENTGIGYSSLISAVDTNFNTAIGSVSLQNTTSGSENTAVGYGTLLTNTTGAGNIALGYNAGRYRGTATLTRTTGTGGIYIGYQSRASANAMTDEIVIGRNAVGLGSSTAVIGATAQSSATIYGVMNLPGGLSASGGITFAGTVSSDTGYRISSSAINSQTGTTYTFLTADNGEVITFNNVSAITVTIPTGLPVGFNCTAIQLGAGQVGFTGASGVTLNSYGSLLKIAGQHGAATVISYSSNIYNIAGTLST